MSNYENSVVVLQHRYDELLHKEALLENIEKLHGRISEYAFRDVIGHLLKTEKMVTSDEEA